MKRLAPVLGVTLSVGLFLGCEGTLGGSRQDHDSAAADAGGSGVDGPPGTTRDAAAADLRGVTDAAIADLAAGDGASGAGDSAGPDAAADRSTPVKGSPYAVKLGLPDCAASTTWSTSSWSRSLAAAA